MPIRLDIHWNNDFFFHARDVLEVSTVGDKYHTVDNGKSFETDSRSANITSTLKTTLAMIERTDFWSLSLTERIKV